jgi:hypothetical protein
LIAASQRFHHEGTKGHANYAVVLKRSIHAAFQQQGDCRRPTPDTERERSVALASQSPEHLPFAELDHLPDRITLKSHAKPNLKPSIVPRYRLEPSNEISRTITGTTPS